MKVAVNVLLVVASLSFAVILAELYLALDDYHPDTSQYTNEFVFGERSYRLIERVDVFDRVENAVLIVGDSFTAGNACASSTNYPIAFTAAAKAAGARFHAVNMGIPGTMPVGYTTLVLDFLDEGKQPHGVIVTLYANDIELDCQSCKRIQDILSSNHHLSAGQLEEMSSLCAPCLDSSLSHSSERVVGEVGIMRKLNWWLTDRSRVFIILRESIARIALAFGVLDRGDWGRTKYPKRWRDTTSLHFRILEASLLKLYEELSVRDIPMMIVFYPDVAGGVNDRNPNIEIYESASLHLMKSIGVPVHSGYHAFLGHQEAEKGMGFSLTDPHPSCAAHEIFGQWVFELWSGLVPEEA